jgi:thioredoxin-related protein
VKKTIIILLLAAIIVVIFVSATTVSQNEDFEKEVVDEEQAIEPQGRNLSIRLDEKMGFSAP